MDKSTTTKRVSQIAALGLLAAGAVFAPLQTPVQAASDTPALQAAPGNAVKEGSVSYLNHCAICHGDEREGILPGFPPLVGIQHQMTDDKIIAVIRQGKGRMPGFPRLPDAELASLVTYLSAPPAAPVLAANANSKLSPEAAAGGAIFLQNCAFCHGRDAMGGETGPDLTQSKIVLGDKDGSAIAAVVREGRIEKKMPAFQFSNSELASLAAFIHARVIAAASMKGGRRGVEVADLQTGNAAAGKQYFNGSGGCAKCHSATGDLAGIANRFEGLRLEEVMLYPRDARSKVAVTLPSGEVVRGILAYQDEFTIGLRDSNGSYRSWPTARVKFTVDSPVQAHIDQFPKYTDKDVHDLMAYLQTLR
jgi:cbb3-type cytochrome c oxidase subunit III